MVGCWNGQSLGHSLLKVKIFYFFFRFYKGVRPCKHSFRVPPRVLEWSHISEEHLKLKLCQLHSKADAVYMHV